MRIIERRISAREDGGGHIVEFVYEDGKRASVVLSDADSVGLGQDELIRKAERLLEQIDASEARGDMPPYGIGDGPNSLAEQTARAKSLGTDPSNTPDQPEGPVPPKNPLLDEQDENADIVGLKGEGLIEP
jgi:hypothetical protein